VVRWIGTARAPVAGSGAAPAWIARVSNDGSDDPAIGGLRAWESAALWAILALSSATGFEESTMKVSDILRVKGSTLYTVTPDKLLLEAVNTMADNDIGSLVVMDKGHLTGMLTFREVIKAVVRNGGSVGDSSVRSVMDDAPLTCTPETEIDEVRRMMLGRHARYMPVLDDLTLMGVISFYDVARAVVDSQDFENRMLKAYIRDWPVEEEGARPVA
jgi:CBS domain-containing protein